jgi:hypothetical protein
MSDNEIYFILAQRFGGNFADYAVRNLAGWCINMLVDESRNAGGPQAGKVVSEQFFDAHPEWHHMRSDVPWVEAA